MRISAAFLLVVLSVLMIIASFKFPGSYMEVQAEKVFLSSSMENWLGTDSLGRDYFWRLILGLRTSFIIAFGSAVISFMLGGFLGSLAAWKGGHTEILLNRFFDIIQGLPSFLFLAVIMQFFISNAAIALAFFLGIFHFTQLARLTRAQVSKTLQEPYVDAAISLGGSATHIMRKHLWPSVYTLWLTWFCYHVPAEIMFEGTLSFLGFGIQPPQTSLGLLIQEGWKYLDEKPMFLFAPAILSFLVVISFRSLLQKAKV